MKYQILEVTGLAPWPLYQVQVKTWWGGWRNIADWHQPEIGEMPGWWSEYFVSMSDAERAIANHAAEKSKMAKKIVISR